MQNQIYRLLKELHTSLDLTSETSYWVAESNGTLNPDVQYSGVIDDSRIGTYYTKPRFKENGTPSNIPLQSLDYLEKQTGDLWDEIADQLSTHPMLQSNSTFSAEDFMQGVERVLSYIQKDDTDIGAEDVRFALTFMTEVRLQEEFPKRLYNMLVSDAAQKLKATYGLSHLTD